MPQPRRLSSGKWRVQIRRQGQRFDKVFDNRTDARKWAKEIEWQIQPATKYAADSAAGKRTVEDLLDRYERDHQSTEGSQNARREWWRNVMGDLALNLLTPSAIADAMDMLTCGPATKNRYQSSLSVACAYAVTPRVGWLADNPVSKLPRLKESKGRTRWLRDDERERLLEACKASTWPGLHTLVLMAVASGARQGELLGLRWKNVDLSKGTVYFEETKNGDARLVPLAPAALDALREWGKVRRIDRDALVFASELKPRQPIEFRKCWLKAVADAELENLRFHDLRHSAGSYLAQAGLSVRQIASLLGHRTLHMAMRYSHLADEHHADIKRVMQERLG